MNTIGVELSAFLCEQFDLSFGENFFYTRVPDVAGPVYWLTLINSVVNRNFKTKQKIKEYSFVLNYRDISSRIVDEKIFEIETILNRLTCTQFENFELYELSTSNLGTYEDNDVEGRFKGSIQIVVKILDDYHS